MKALRLLVLVFIAGCVDPVSLPPYSAPASLQVVSGDEQADTIGQWLPEPIVVEVRDSADAPLPGVIVRFEPIMTSIPQEPFAGLFDRLGLSPADSLVERRLYIGMTDAQGRVAVRVKFSVWSGPVGMIISAPEGGAVDTARFTALPGEPWRISFVNRDTTLVTGGDLQVQMRVEDGYRNVRDDVPTLGVSGAIASVNEQRVAHAGAPGPGFVAASLGSLVDTMRVAVVPNATLAVIEHQLSGNWGLSVVSLDGLQRQRLVTSLGQLSMPAWSPSGTEIAYYEGFNGNSGNARLFIVTTAGERRPLLQTLPPTLITAFMPRWSPDGEWIYFTGDVTNSMQTWRVRQDGTSAERLLPDAQNTLVSWEPDASPDGQRLALTYDGTVSLLDLTTRVRTQLIAGEFPRFSPAGDALVYINIQPGLVSPLYFVKSDGTGFRQLTPVGRMYGRFAGHSWSPDGQWIVVRGQSRLELVRVATGEVMTLPYSGAMYQPVFRP